MLRKKEVYTNVTPIPSFIPRQLAIDILHSHGEIITLNPLVLEHRPIKAPRDAAVDEFYSTWYEITERIQYIPGIGKMGSGKINFKGCFHNMPWGLQTHIYAPANVDLKNKWQIAGNQPGEPREPRELGINAPADGLYLREDIEIKCNFAIVSFVKSQLKAASKVLVDRLIKKAELLDAGVLHAMMEDGMLKTINPADQLDAALSQSPPEQRPLSPKQQYQIPRLPTASCRSSSVGEQNRYQHHHQGPVGHLVELPGDTFYPSALQSSSRLYPPGPGNPRRESTTSEYSETTGDADAWRWSDYKSSTSSRPTSYASDTSDLRPPGLDHKSFATGLPAMAETGEEHDVARTTALKKLERRESVEPAFRYKYNPQDFAHISLSGNRPLNIRKDTGPHVILP